MPGHFKWIANLKEHFFWEKKNFFWEKKLIERIVSKNRFHQKILENIARLPRTYFKRIIYVIIDGAQILQQALDLRLKCALNAKNVEVLLDAIVLAVASYQLENK